MSVKKGPLTKEELDQLVSVHPYRANGRGPDRGENLIPRALAELEEVRAAKLRDAERKCASCRFFDKQSEGGYCRVGRPAVVPVDDGGRTRFPFVKPDEWCGEWRSS